MVNNYPSLLDLAQRLDAAMLELNACLYDQAALSTIQEDSVHSQAVAAFNAFIHRGKTVAASGKFLIENGESAALHLTEEAAAGRGTHIGGLIEKSPIQIAKMALGDLKHTIATIGVQRSLEIAQATIKYAPQISSEIASLKQSANPENLSIIALLVLQILSPLDLDGVQGTAYGPIDAVFGVGGFFSEQDDEGNPELETLTHLGVFARAPSPALFYKS